MRIILTLAALALLSNCAVGSFPEFPSDIKYQYAVQVVGEPLPLEIMQHVNNVEVLNFSLQETEVRCLEFEILSKYPYKIKFTREAPIKVCNGVGGYAPSQFQSLLNWVDDVRIWSQDRKRCFKE